jgi:IS30 family transposase
MKYRQITIEERYAIGLLRRQGYTTANIARILGRHRSTILREVRRNRKACDGGYRPQLADWYARGRRSRSRRNRRFSKKDLKLVRRLLKEQWSPEQIAGRLSRQGTLQISHETIYRYVWTDKRRGGMLYTHLRGAQKQRRKRYRSYDSRGRLASKRHISTRPAVVDTRKQVGHWEVDTVVGPGKPCLLSLVERKTGYVVIGKLEARTTAEVNRRATKLIRQQQRKVITVTADNGTEFHGYSTIEKQTSARFYFANPYHSWERGTNENTNGLIRQY